MTIKEYKKLASACDALLRNSMERPERVAFSALHLLGPHPAQLQKFEKKSWPPSKLPGLFFFSARARILAASLFPHKVSDLWSGAVLPAITHLIISHEIGAKPGLSDFYFGQIPAKLTRSGANVLVIKINHVGWKIGSFSPVQRASRLFTAILPGWSSGKNEHDITGMVQREFEKLRHQCENRSTLYQKIWLALKHPSSRLAAVRDLRFYFWMRALLRQIKPANLLFTWEGHAWERLAIRAARETDPQIKCIGYQHTVLFPHARGPLLSLGKRHDPDEIWTVGRANRQRLNRKWKKARVRVYVYGSPRHRKSSPPNTPKEALCIVAPEGIPREAVALFEFGKRLALAAPEITVHFRSHPILPFRNVAQAAPGLRNLPANVQIRDQGGQGEIRKASWFLYRGTSLVFEALQAGARPLYLRRPREIPIDPLSELAFWRAAVQTPKDALDRIRMDIKKKSPTYFRERLKAQKWAGDFFSPEAKLLPGRFRLPENQSK